MTTRRDVLKGGSAAGFFGWRGGIGTGEAIQSFTSIALDNYSFTPNGSTPVNVGNVVVGVSGGTSDGATITLSGADAASFQLTNGGVMPCVLQAKAATGTGTYADVGLTATKAGVSNSPYGPIALDDITGAGTPTGQFLWNLTESNNTGSDYTANTRLLMRGLVFKDGDLAAGAYPQLLAGGVAQPFTVISTAPWPSGAVKHMAVAIRPTYALTAGLEQAIAVWNGGSAPAASGRTFADLAAQDLFVEVQAADAGANLTGTWAAYAQADANRFANYTIGDGAAGLIGLCRMQMAQSEGGAAHGQLEVDLYYCLLNDAAGNLGATACAARIGQPNYNVDSPAKNARAFKSVKLRHGAGPTDIEVNGPNNDGTYDTVNFTWTSAKNFSAPGNKWYQGANGGNNIIPGYVTTTGTLPGGLTTDQLYFVRPNSAGGSAFYISTYTNTSGQVAITGTSAGSGTHTFHPVNACAHFGTTYCADDDACWHIFQGTGSIASPIISKHAKYDQTYWQSARVFGSIDLSLVGTITAGTWAYKWTPVGFGPLYQFQSTTGSRPDIAPFNMYQMRHFYTQAADDERLARFLGLAAAFESFNFKDSTTHNHINLSNTNYTGMLPASATQRGIGWASNGGSGSGWTKPPAYNACQFFSQNNMSHNPEMAGYAWMVFGEPQYLDMLVECANGAILSEYQTFRNPTSPVSAYGVLVFDTQLRIMAWGHRNMALAAGLVPDSYWDGSQLSQYIRARLSESLDFIVNQTMTEAATNAFCMTNGIWEPNRPGDTSSSNIAVCTLPFYLPHAMLLAYIHRGDANALAWLKHYITYHLFQLDYANGWCSHQYTIRDISGYGSGGTLTFITAANQFASDSNNSLTVTWTVGSKFTFNTSPTNSGASPADGMIIIFRSGRVPGGFTANTPYYLRDTVGNDANLAASAGGAALPAPTNASSISQTSHDGPYWVPTSITGYKGVTGAGNGDSYATEALAVWNICKALGITANDNVTTVDDLITNATNYATQGGALTIDWNTNCAWARQASFA